AHGQALINSGTGAITYTANTGFYGTDTLQYTVMDDNGATSNPGLVSVVVQPASSNGQLTANDVLADTDGVTPVAIDVLSHVTGPNSLVPSSVKVVSGPAHGQATVNTNTGVITYTAAAGFGGSDTFKYTVQDTSGATSNAGNVTVVVHLPHAEDDFA